MNELKQRLAAIGLSEGQVNQAIETVSGFVKEKLPEEYRGMVDELLAGRTPDMSQLAGGFLDKMKGFFGGSSQA